MNKINKIQNRKSIYRLLRIGMDLSVDELAKKIGISRSYIFAIENEGKIPSDKIIKAYSDFFGISQNALKEIESKKNQNSFEKLLLEVLNYIVK